jgi:hypothetical protein
MKNITSFSTGVFIGICLTLLMWHYSTKRDAGTNYVVLSHDILLDNSSILKSGTKLRIDEGMSEGFTRYILYVNANRLDARDTIHPHRNCVIPYWKTSTLKSPSEK